MQRTIGWLALALMLTSLSGCSYLFYPRASDYAAQAKGASGVETTINLANMMEATAAKAKGGKGIDSAFDDLHNQFHALRDSFCGARKWRTGSRTRWVRRWPSGFMPGGRGIEICWRERWAGERRMGRR